MATQLILISHGHFCDELKKSVEMIMGPQADIHTVALLPEESAEDFKDKFLATVAAFDDYVVFADLLGGTPCNVVTRLILEGQEIELYAGMNMPMIIGFINAILLNSERNFVADGATHIHHVNMMLANTDDDEDE